MNYFNIKSLFFIAAIFVGFAPVLVVAADEAQKPVVIHVSHEEAKKKQEEDKKKIEEKKEEVSIKEETTEDNNDSDKKEEATEAPVLDAKKAKTWCAALAGIVGITYFSGICKAYPQAAWLALGFGLGAGTVLTYQALQEEETAF